MRLVLECRKYVVPPLQTIKNYLQVLFRKRKFLQEWKKDNFVPVHKKKDKQLVDFVLYPYYLW